METHTLVNCGKELIVGVQPVITRHENRFCCDIDYVGKPGVKLKPSNARGWNSIWCHTSGCRFRQMGKITVGIRVQEE